MLKYIYTYSASISLPCFRKAHQAQRLLCSLSACHFSTNLASRRHRPSQAWEVLHLLSCNRYMSLKIPNHTYSWLAQSECKYSLIQQIFHEHLLCDRHHSQHRAHGRKQYTHPLQGSLRSSRTEETGKTQVYIEYSVLALYTLGIQNSQVFSALR